ncbi:MAG: ATP-binding protein, partial [Hyphomicrobium sp.]
MRRWYNRSIRNKLTAVVLLSVIPALLIASVLGAFREADHQGASRRAEFQGIANALAAAASEPLAAKDRRQVANALKGIGAIPNLTHISVRDSTGLTVFQFGTGILVSQNTRRDVFNLNTHPVEAEIRHAGKPIGRLLLIADISDVSDALSRSLKAALIAGVMSALAGLLASYRMQRAVATPIAELKQAMSDVRHMKDFTRTVTRSSHDETGELVDAFNSMMGEINTRDRALADHRAGLENEVRARTHDLAEAVDAAQSANRAKSEFLATMSHEIRTPMNGMLVMAELLAASELTPRAQRHCEVILRSGQTLLSIINDILDLSKIEAGHLTLERVSVVPAAIVDDIVKLFSERAASKGLQLAAYVAPDVPAEVVGDPVRLSQILSNLVNNALKFTEAGGVLVRVDVGRHDADSVEAWEAALRFSVIDNGIGIPADKLASIFDPFTQAEASTTRRFGGTGIGLTICRKLADAMGGALRVESVLGAGSTFSFELPMDGNAAHAQSVRDVDSDKDRRGAMMLAIPAG